VQYRSFTRKGIADFHRERLLEAVWLQLPGCELANYFRPPPALNELDADINNRAWAQETGQELPISCRELMHLEMSPAVSIQ
jgi:hypothetical protein